jgi:aspartate aminotransferase
LPVAPADSVDIKFALCLSDNRENLMIVAQNIQQQLERSSWIRRMFEEGIRLKAERGVDNIFDFTLGNPNEDPPSGVLETFRKLAAENKPGSHGYMPNAGYPFVRQKLAERLKRDTGLEFTENNVLMTVGAAGAMNVAFKAILDPGEEVIVLKPFFPEYEYYISNSSGKMVQVETREDFSIDVAAIESKITPRTRAIILNSPNNPSGAIYSEKELRDLEAMLQSAHHPIIVISDEPYKAIVYDGVKCPETASIITNCVIANSWSKTWALAGERIGYLAISPRMQGAEMLYHACTYTTRILGFVNAPAIWQSVAALAPDEMPDIRIYAEKRNLMCDGLAGIGYEVRKPQGAFYIFLRTPIPDDAAFVGILRDEGVLAVPGSGFGRSGYIRLSLTVPREMIVRSLPGFEAARTKALAGK